jgi:RNA-directed DNA polymerase
MEMTRVVHIRHGFEFLGYTIKRGKRLKLSSDKIRSAARSGELYAFPREKSIRRFMDQVRALTRRRVPLKTKELIEELNPILRGWGHYYKKAHVRKLFNRLDRWIVRRIWSHRLKRWRNLGWRSLPERKLYGEYGLVNLIQLIPSLASRTNASSSVLSRNLRTRDGSLPIRSAQNRCVVSAGDGHLRLSHFNRKGRLHA